MDLLEERIRRSSRLKQACAFREFLAYACLVSDEDEVYSFMEQNKIGITEPQFWSSKLTMLKNKCEYKEFLKVIKQVNKNQELKKHPKYWLIQQLAKQLEKHLERLLRSKVRSKRSGRQYQLLNFQNVEKQTHKFGRIQVYVDPDCRMQYRLQDLIDFVTERLSSECEVEKNCYYRQMSKKPLSFIGKDKEKIEKLSLQVFGLKERNMSGRISIVGRQSNKAEVEIRTPEVKKRSKSINKQNKQQRESISQLHTIESLKQNVRKSIINSQKNMKQIQGCNPQYSINERSPSLKKEKVRKFFQQQQEMFSQSDLDHSSQNLFQQESNDKISSNEHNAMNAKSSQNIENKDSKEQQFVDNLNDIAFIQQTQPQIQSKAQAQARINQSLELQNIIKQIQMQKYQSQTLSEIDSNKQNNIFTHQSNVIHFSNNGPEHGSVMQLWKEERKKFQTLKKGKAINKLQDDERERENQLNHHNVDASQSSLMEYQTLLEYLGDQKEKKEKQEHERHSMSTRESKKRISRISEQRSYSYSEAKPASSRGGEMP